jgi:hypothetical protein
MLDNNQPKRYNRTFIGLMEQCNDGEWVRYKDVTRWSDYIEEEFDDLEYKLSDCKHDYNTLQRRYFELQASNNITQVVTLATLVSFAGFLVARFIYG